MKNQFLIKVTLMNGKEITPQVFDDLNRAAWYVRHLPFFIPEVKAAVIYDQYKKEINREWLSN